MCSAVESSGYLAVTLIVCVCVCVSGAKLETKLREVKFHYVSLKREVTV